MPTIRELRQEQGWTQFELAIKVGVQPQTVYLWESGRRMPLVPQLRSLGRLFELCSDEIDLESQRGVAGRTGDRVTGASISSQDGNASDEHA